MAEIQTISDRVTVLRDGHVVATGIDDYTDAQLNDLIAGRELSLGQARAPDPPRSARRRASRS